jgi:hypothetical protein
MRRQGESTAAQHQNSMRQKEALPRQRTRMQGRITSRAEKIQRLVQLYSELDLADLSTMQRATREQEMASVYQAFDEE